MRKKEGETWREEGSARVHTRAREYKTKRMKEMGIEEAKKTRNKTDFFCFKERDTWREEGSPCARERESTKQRERGKCPWKFFLGKERRHERKKPFDATPNGFDVVVEVRREVRNPLCQLVDKSLQARRNRVEDEGRGVGTRIGDRAGWGGLQKVGDRGDGADGAAERPQTGRGRDRKPLT
jgi:hypothetical protein